MNYHPFCPTVLADLAEIKLNCDVLSSVWSQVIVQTCAAHLVPVLLFATSWLAGWRGDCGLWRAAGRNWWRQGERQRDSRTGTGRDRISAKGKGCWAGRKQHLWGTGERQQFGNPESEQSSVTQEQESSKGLSVSCEDRVGKRQLALPTMALESVLFFAAQTHKQCSCSVCFRKRKDL